MAEQRSLAQQPTPKIRIRGLKKVFGDKVVLNGIDLDVRAGDHLVLLGVSGSGKTVLLKCILGLIDADAGSVIIDGENIIERPPVANEQLMQRIGVLFQNGALFDSLTIWENITFGIKDKHALDAGEAKAIAKRKLAAVGLGSDVADLYPAEVSGGMQKRVAFARAFVINPEILLLDSPTAGLDPFLKSIVNRLMKTTIG
ncbi:MAG: ATP-binding cassette domain-containing protein, partial [Pseudomonadota bacterium]